MLSQIYIYVANIVNEKVKLTGVTRQVRIYFLSKYSTQIFFLFFFFEVSSRDLQRSRIAHKFAQMRRVNLRIKLAYTLKVVF